MLKTDHIVLTRFSFRGKHAFARKSESRMWELYEDPLKPENLTFRFKLFEVFGLPGVLNQTCQQFTWILLIDKELPASFRKRLDNLIKSRKNTHLHVYDQNMVLEETDWLQPYMNKDSTHLITTNLDDDDVMPVNYIETLQHHVRELHRTNQLPPAKILATKNVKQWDVVTSKKSPYGLLCKKLPTPSNIGFSLMIEKARYNLIVWGLRHTEAEEYFDPSCVKQDKNLKFVRNALGYNQNNKGLSGFRMEDLFHDVGESIAPVLLINHFKNVQQWRLHKSKAKCRHVTGIHDLEDVAVDFNLFKEYAGDFSKKRAFFYMMKVLMTRKYLTTKSGGRPARLKNYLNLLRWYFWR